MHYGILVNPAAGRFGVPDKMRLLKGPASVLNAQVHGLDTRSREELGQCARRLAQSCDVVVVAGGDGTFSDIVNTIDTSETAVAYLPLGTGNALKHGFGYRGDLSAIARRIRRAPVRRFDLVDCHGRRKAFMASVGIEGAIVKLWRQYPAASGSKIFRVYVRGILEAYFKAYRPATAHLVIDGFSVTVENLMSLMILKQPFYGLGLNVLPGARWDDRKLHLTWLRAGLPNAAALMLTGFIIGNRTGSHRTGDHLAVRLSRPASLQIDGDYGWESDRFSFRVLPEALKIKC